MAFDKSNPLTIGLVALFVVATVAALFGGGVSGRAISYTVVPMDFPVIAEYTEGWGTCTGQSVSWTAIDSFCKSEGYAGAAPIESRPCMHEWQPERWIWDGSLPMIRGELDPQVGYALTQVKCI